MPKFKQIVWFKKEEFIELMKLSQQLQIAENVIISRIVQEAFKDKTFLNNVIEKLKKTPYQFFCKYCGKEFNNEGELIEHGYYCEKNPYRTPEYGLKGD